MYLPSADGVTHINIYTKGATKLGRLLTNLADTPVTIDFEGTEFHFKSLEGFWYFYVMWKHTKEEYEEFCNYTGFEAKKIGKQYVEELDIDTITITSRKAFKKRFSEAIKSKLRQNRKEIFPLLAASELPFAHYYYFGDIKNPKVQALPHHDWQLEVFEEARASLKKYLKEKNNES
jgi:hypothetical protein